MSEENFSPQESLLLIQSMISKTKQHMSDSSIYFLIWGWLTFSAFVGQFILKNIVHYEKHYLVWLVIFVGIFLTLYQGKKNGNNKKVKTYVGDSIRYLWTGMGITFFVLSMILSKLGWDTAVYPFFITMYGLGTFVSGSIIQFRPLVIGGIISWMLAIAAAYVSYDYQMLFGAAAILFSYIIPAYIMRGKNKTTIN